MRPRTTQESYRPRVSNRIMVGSFSEANTSACVASRTEGVEPPSQHETKWRQSIQLPWSCSRSDTARRQPSEQSTSGWMQAKQPPLSGEQGRIFILTSPLIGFLGRLVSTRACLRFANQVQYPAILSCRSIDFHRLADSRILARNTLNSSVTFLNEATRSVLMIVAGHVRSRNASNSDQTVYTG